MTIKISQFNDRQMSTIARLLNEEYKDTHEFIPFNEERIRSQIRRRDLKILIAEENGKVLGLIATHIEEEGEENITLLAADAGSNRKTIENTLINQIEKNAKSDTVTTMVDEGSPKTKDWTNRGYVICPGWLRMSAKLDGLKPIPQTGQDTELRSLRPDEEEKLIETMNTGFGWQRLEPGTLQAWKTEDPPFSEDWVHIAEINERVVSAVVSKPDTDYIKYLHINRGYLGPAATLPEFRNRHLASALTARAMNFLFEKRMTSVRLGTNEKNISSIALLRSLGFQVDNIRKIMRKNLKNT
jgi:ribosomal protein S18 acetylase RimI-like enzyme